MRKTFALVAMLAATVVLVPASQAITDGVPDVNDDFPYVGLMVAQNAGGSPLWRCSGTLISSTVFVTAGHCVEAPAAHVEIWFDNGYPSQIPRGSLTPPDTNCAGDTGYPCDGDVGGDPYPVPGYTFPTRDLGVVDLDSPWDTGGAYGALPTAGQLDSLKPKASTKFTTVGYGLQTAFPTATDWKESGLRTRMIAEPHLIQINTGIVGDYALLLSDNANTGGACFGDSGGPNFLGDTNTLAGVTSFVLNYECAGTGGAFRLDKADLIAWVNSFLS